MSIEEYRGYVGVVEEGSVLGLCWKVMDQLVSKEPVWNLNPKKLLKCCELQNLWLVSKARAYQYVICWNLCLNNNNKRHGYILGNAWTSHLYVRNSKVLSWSGRGWREEMEKRPVFHCTVLCSWFFLTCAIISFKNKTFKFKTLYEIGKNLEINIS